MTTPKEDQMRAAFEHHILNIAPINLSRCDDGDYCDMVIDSRWMDWKACAESYEKKLDAEYMRGHADGLKGGEIVDCTGELQHQLSEANARNAMLVEAIEDQGENYADIYKKLVQSQQSNAMLVDAMRHAQKQPYPFGHLELFEKAISANSEAVAAYERDVAAKALEKFGNETLETISHSDVDDHSFENGKEAAAKDAINCAAELRANKVKGEYR